MKEGIELGQGIAKGQYDGYWLLTVVLLVGCVAFGFFIFWLVKHFIGDKLDKIETAVNNSLVKSAVTDQQILTLQKDVAELRDTVHSK